MGQRSEPGFDPWIGEDPLEKGRLLSPVFWPGEFHELYTTVYYTV